ncbi:ATP synthase F1 subunit gamma [Candidatus Peregrinibacteria bacterium]|nr:ATP synthase F1 subunit gamma [Candidatus Peregrinibacteria bacterium]
MASLRDLKIRIKSIKSTQKIARAMEMVAASKMKKAQQQALAGRPYLSKLREVLYNLIYSSEPRLKHAFLDAPMRMKGSSKKVGYILVSADRGLCGAFNANIIKTTLEKFSDDGAAGRSVITVGKKVRQAMQRIGQSIQGDFVNMANSPKFIDTVGVSEAVVEEYLAGNLDEVYLIYSQFISTATQKPKIEKLLPVEPELDFTADGPLMKADYIFEGEKQLLLDELLHRFVDTTVYQAVLESAASEHSARMMAMHKAADNAKEIVANLTLEYNKTRQTKITTQILEIVGGVQ